MAEVLPTVSTPFTLLLTLGSDVFLQQALAIWGLVLIWVLSQASGHIIKAIAGSENSGKFSKNVEPDGIGPIDNDSRYHLRKC